MFQALIESYNEKNFGHKNLDFFVSFSPKKTTRAFDLETSKQPL